MFVSKRLSCFLAAICALFLSVGTMSAQNLNVTGTVVDKSGEPIVGAYVIIEGTQTGATTDIDGVYQISAPSNGTLVFTCMGYKDTKVAVNGRSKVNVTLADDALMLSEAVAVGYGTQKKENLTGAVASISAEKALDSRPIADVGRGLQGMTPGLNVRVGSGEVGSDPLIKIRGQVGSYNGSSTPLILLDNVEIPSISVVNPDDIESISILKDAASASIYGAKAAFGVILITSKKGSKEAEKVNVTYSGNLSIQTLAKDYQMAGLSGITYSLAAATVSAKTTGAVGAFWYVNNVSYPAVVEFQEKYADLPYDSPLTYGRDWYMDENGRKMGVRLYDPYDYMVKDVSFSQNHALSVAGSKGNTNFNISLGYLDQDGVLKPAKHDDYRRWNANIRVNTKVNDFLAVRAGLMYSKSDRRYPLTSFSNINAWQYVYRWGPNFPIVAYDEFGQGTRSTTYEVQEAGTASMGTNYTSANVGTTITPVENWDINFDYTFAETTSTHFKPGTHYVGADVWYGTGDYYVDGVLQYAQNEWNAYNGLGATIPMQKFANTKWTTVGGLTDQIYQSTSIANRHTYNATTTYDWDINDKNNVRFMLGMNAVAYESRGHTSKRTILSDPNNPQFSLATGTQTVSGSHSWNSQAGFFGRINYNYDEKYLLEANIRYDGSSKFPAALKWRWFPSFSAGWRVSEEDWFEDAKDVVSSLKVRASWGSIGDQSVSNSLYIPTMSQSGASWVRAGALDNYYATPAAVASDITWQDIETIDFGVDFSLFNSVNVTFDWYKRNTNNMIVPGPGLGYNFGTSAPSGNYGSLSTNGWELMVNYGHMFDNGLSLNLTATLADAVTTITEYGTSTSVGGWYNGKTYGEIWGYRFDRLLTEEDFVWTTDAEGNKIHVVTSDSKNRQINKMAEGIATQGELRSGTQRSGWLPGDPLFKDIWGKDGTPDGEITAGTGTVNFKPIYDAEGNVVDYDYSVIEGYDVGDREVIGNSTPRYEYSFRVDADWKGFDLSIFFQGIGKRDMVGNAFLTVPGYNSSDGSMPETFAANSWYEIYDAAGKQVVASNYDAKYPRARNWGGGPSTYWTNNDHMLLDMSYLRLKNLTFGYTLPKKLTQKAQIEKLRLYLSCENLLTFDNLDGLPIDPEVYSNAYTYGNDSFNSGRQGVEAPAFRSTSFGVQLTF